MATDDVYLNCRRALGVGFTDVFKKARERRIDMNAVEEIFKSEITRDEAICGLRSCGMSNTDIGVVVGLTRERVRQIVTDADLARSGIKQKTGPNARRIDTDMLRQLLCTSPEFWNVQGILKLRDLIDYFARRGHTEKDVRDALDAVGINNEHSKAEILLTYWLQLPKEKHYKYFSDQLRTINQSQLLAGLTNQKPVGLSIMAFNKYMRSMGIYSEKSGAGIRRSYGKDDDDWEWLRKASSERIVG